MNESVFQTLVDIGKSDKSTMEYLQEVLKKGGVDALMSMMSGNVYTTNLRFWDETTSKTFIGTGSGNWYWFGKTKLRAQDIKLIPEFSGIGSTSNQLNLLVVFQTNDTAMLSGGPTLDYTGITGWSFRLNFYGTNDVRLRQIDYLDGSAIPKVIYTGFSGSGVSLEDLGGRAALRSVGGFESKWSTTELTRISQVRYMMVYIDNASTSEITLTIK